MKIHKKSLLIGSASLVLLGGCSLFNAQNTSQQTESETTTTEISKADLAKFEKIAEEVKENKPKTIVGEVFENGYLKKHGDHYHFVYGAPPADAIYEQKTSATTISSADDGYVFNPNDIVEENEMGYVVRHGDHFHFIYKNNTQQTLATTMATNTAVHEHHEEVEDGYVFDKKDVVSETETGYIVRHGDHFHFIYKDKQGNPVVTTDHHEHEGEHHHHDGDKHDHEGEHHDHDHDGYVFDKKDIVSETAEGYVVRHGDHFHFIYKDKQGNSVATAEQHHHDADKHDHDGNKHDHEGEHHDHDNDGFVFRKEDIESETESGYVVRHGNHFHFVYKDKNGKPILDNHHHDHDGDKHEHEGEHHDHKNEATSENHGSTIPNEKDLNEKSPEIQKYLDYITYAYGVERDTIKLESAYKDGKYVGKVFAFQNMEQGQDKTHIHPWAIPLRNFEVPSSDESIDPELRFAQEIASLAKRMGISVKDIRILGDKFEVPHGDHSHSLRIQNIEGAKKYVANKLKEITPTYIAGDLDTKAVESQIEVLANKASEKYKTQPVELSRILTSLREIKERLDEKGNSTQGYLELLKQFDEKYIEKASTVTTPELSKEEKALNSLHESIIRTINDLELNDYNVTKDELRAAANKAIEAKDMKALEAVRDYVQALQDANKRLGVEGMKYLYFLTQHVQDKPLPFELREKVSDLIAKLSKAKFIPGETGTTEAIISPSYFATKEIKKAHENPAGKVDTRVGDKYKAIAKPDDEESMSKLDEMKEFAEMALEQADKDDSVPTSDFREELSDEVKKDLATPKSKDQKTSENTTTPKAEEATASEASTPTETVKPVVTDKAEGTVAPATTTPTSQPATSASEQPHA